MKYFSKRHLVLATIALCLLSIYNLQAQVGVNEDVKNPNLAGEKELAALPQINNEIAKELIENRPFLNMAQFDEFLKKHITAEQTIELYPELFIPINLNNASREEILLVPGVGNRLAHEFEEYKPYIAITQFRREIGKYVDDTEVARLEKFVYVPINLNTASDDDILSIPGVGNRMLHEFKEYRPYKSMEQFRREIGKYVDDNEVARLERYLVLE